MRAESGPVDPRAGRRRTWNALGRALVLVAVLVAWFAVGAFGGMAQGTLSEVQENDSAAFLPSSAESTRADELAAGFRDDESLPALVVITASDGEALSDEQVAAAQTFVDQVPDLELPGGQPLGDVLTGPAVVVPAEDGEALLVPVSIDGDRADEQLGDTGERVVNAVVAELRDQAGGDLTAAGLDAWVTGPGGLIADLVSAFGGIDGILLVVALIGVLIILFIVYRSPVLPFAVLLTAVFGLAAAALVVKPLAGNGTLLLNGQSQGILSILVVGAATDYSLLVVARYREELTRHERPLDAMRAAWRAAVEPIAASAATVIVGLLCLLLSDLGSNASLGPVGAIGIASSVLAALTLLPALLLIPARHSRALFWPRVPRWSGTAGAEPQEHGHAEASMSTGLWERVADFVTSHARPTWISAAVLLLAMAAFVPTLRADGTGESDVFLAETESVTGEQVLSEHFDAGQVQPIIVITTEDRASAVEQTVGAVDGVLSATVLSATVLTDASDQGAGGPGGPPEDADQGAGGPGGPPEDADQGAPGGPPDGADAPEGSEDAAPLVVNGRVQVQAATTDAAETQQAVKTAQAVRYAVQDVDPDAVVGGAAAQRLDTQLTAEQDLRTIIPLVLLAILVMLIVLLRAVVAPLLLLAANLLSFGATMGLAAVMFNHVFDFPGADANVPLYGFVFLVALSIDYSIFLMTRVREESLQVGTREGVRRGLAVTGGVITSAGLVLAATFSALSIIPLLFLAQLAFIVAVGVLIDTFIVRTLLVAGLVHDVGRAVWWPWRSRIPHDHGAPRHRADVSTDGPNDPSRQPTTAAT